MTIMAPLNKCVGCSEAISDMYYLIVGSNFYWHLSCLKCSECACSLHSKCYMNGGKFYCLDDYNKLNKSTNALEPMSISSPSPSNTSCKRFSCPTCLLTINANDYVIKLANAASQTLVYHLNCFVCTECHKLIAPGHQYAIINEKIFCSHHYFMQLSSSTLSKEAPINSITQQQHQHQNQYHGHQMLAQNHSLNSKKLV